LNAKVFCKISLQEKKTAFRSAVFFLEKVFLLMGYSKKLYHVSGVQTYYSKIIKNRLQSAFTNIPKLNFLFYE